MRDRDSIATVSNINGKIFNYESYCFKEISCLDLLKRSIIKLRMKTGCFIFTSGLTNEQDLF